MNELITTDLANRLNQETSGLSITDTLKLVVKNFPGKASFSTSFGIEDQVITDLIFKDKFAIKVFTLDTGRHFEETYKVHNRTLAKYQQRIEVHHPKGEEVERLLSQKGPFSFYESIENRKECCNIRKVFPLQTALTAVDLWITGVRKQQSSNRQDLQQFEFDPVNKLIKYNPLIDWSTQEVLDYIKENNVPYNSLHDQGFISIGCAPCTRAIEPGQDFRAGRWWWEDNSSKECGLHSHKS